MPPSAYMYAVPYEYHEKYHVRKYGFHGTSVKYLVGQARIPYPALEILLQQFPACHHEAQQGSMARSWILTSVALTMHI